MTDLARVHVRCRSSTAQLSTAAITPTSAQVQALGALFVPYTPPLKSTLPQMVLHRLMELATLPRHRRLAALGRRKIAPSPVSRSCFAAPSACPLRWSTGGLLDVHA